MSDAGAAYAKLRKDYDVLAAQLAAANDTLARLTEYRNATNAPIHYSNDEAFAWEAGREDVCDRIRAAVAHASAPSSSDGVTSLVSEASRLATAEAGRALRKFPTWPTDPLHALAVVGEEFGELVQAVLQHTYEPKKGVTRDDIRNEAVQLAAMALRFFVSLPEYAYTPGDQHTQSEAHATAPEAI